jgi:deoxyribonuclease V
MEIKNTEFLPEPELDREKKEGIQIKIGREAEFTGEINDPEIVVGIDQAFTDDRAVSAAVAIKDGEIIEKTSAAEPLEMPYIPGLLAFREAPAIISALKKLEAEPDLLMLDGSGRIHFRQAGIATHIGVLFNTPAVGIAKNLLCGEPEQPLDQKFQEGRKIPVKADKSMNASENETVGFAYQSRQYSSPNRKINPLIISSGHLIGAENAVKHVANECSGYKLPEPTRLADSYVDKMKEEIG